MTSDRQPTTSPACVELPPRPRLVPELLVADIAASLRFWVSLAGFRVAYDRPETGFAYVERDGAALMLEQQDLADRVWLTADLGRPFGRGVNFEIDVDDLDGILARMEREDWPLFMGLEEKWYRRETEEIGVRQFLVQDPDGYLARFSQRLGVRAAR